MAFYRCADKINILTSLEINGELGGMTIAQGRYLSGFGVSNIYYPSDNNGNRPTYDFSKPFHLHFKVNLSNKTGAQAVCGSNTSYYHLPSIEFQGGNDTLLGAGYSTDGGSWGSWLNIPISEVPFSSTAWYDIDYSWNGTTFTLSCTDGTNTSTKTATIGQFYTPSSTDRLQVGAVYSNNNAYYLTIDFTNTYYEENGVIIWGNKE